MTSDLFGDYFEQVQVLTVCKIVLFCGGIDALKVINGRCIATLRNLEVLHHKILEEVYIILPTNISNMTYPNCQKETGRNWHSINSASISQMPTWSKSLSRMLTDKCFVPNY